MPRRGPVLAAAARATYERDDALELLLFPGGRRIAFARAQSCSDWGHINPRASPTVPAVYAGAPVGGSTRAAHTRRLRGTPRFLSAALRGVERAGCGPDHCRQTSISAGEKVFVRLRPGTRSKVVDPTQSAKSGRPSCSLAAIGSRRSYIYAEGLPEVRELEDWDAARHCETCSHLPSGGVPIGLVVPDNSQMGAVTKADPL